ncbi:hypothetical protein CSUNSWCD_1929 [Campylobacter showae CSUNSWCD]|uniref:Uncharacterized protein n=1 Tax=Campylobacter showae CSUNSWCD TaxID=1244083 RepID=M5IRS2_9BACT|nr:hypothetical protein CSUNSWCD_1929 [Campylobacter showae CSUNSWCD]
MESRILNLNKQSTVITRILITTGLVSIIFLFVNQILKSNFTADQI